MEQQQAKTRQFNAKKIKKSLFKFRRKRRKNIQRQEAAVGI